MLNKNKSNTSPYFNCFALSMNGTNIQKNVFIKFEGVFFKIEAQLAKNMLSIHKVYDSFFS